MALKGFLQTKLKSEIHFRPFFIHLHVIRIAYLRPSIPVRATPTLLAKIKRPVMTSTAPVSEWVGGFSYLYTVSFFPFSLPLRVYSWRTVTPWFM